MNKKTTIVSLLVLIIIGGTFGVFYLNNLNQTSQEVEQRTLRDRLEVLEETVEEFQLARLAEDDGLVGLNETYEYVEIEEGESTQTNLEDNQISNYQTYVTPDSPAVVTVANGKTYEQIYQEALSWTWVEDDIINGMSEKWLSPEVFLTQTPDFSSNPVQGRIASDCESQAYTLVSALRAAGMPAENVRVVTGLVNFGGSTGGHAWVEIYDDELGGWFALEPTSGNYYDSSQGEFIESNGLAYNYFKIYKYPSIQIWNYFNDQYFYDLGLEEGNTPELWLNQDSVSQAPSIEEIKYQIPQYLKDRRNQVIERVENLRDNAEEASNEASQEEIEQKVLEIINQTEELVQEGLTDDERQEIANQLNNSIDEVSVLIEESNLSPAQKATLNSYLRTIEAYVNTGVNQLQRSRIQTQILNGLNELENRIINN